MRSPAQVNEIAVTVDAGRLAEAFDLLKLVTLLELAEKAQGLVLVHLLADKGMVGLDDFSHLFLDALQIFGGKAAFNIDIVVKAFLDRGTEGELGLRVELFYCMGHDMGGTMPKDIHPLGRIGGQKKNAAAPGQGAGQIEYFGVEFGCDRLTSDPAAQFGDQFARLDAFRVLPGPSVGKCQSDHGQSVTLSKKCSP